MKSKRSDISWDALVEYETKDIKYKEAANQMIVNELGFAPALKVRAIAEVMMRSSLKRFDEGELNANQLQNHLETRCQVIRCLIPKYAPHQIPFLETQQAH